MAARFTKHNFNIANTYISCCIFDLDPSVHPSLNSKTPPEAFVARLHTEAWAEKQLRSKTNMFRLFCQILRGFEFNHLKMNYKYHHKLINLIDSSNVFQFFLCLLPLPPFKRKTNKTMSNPAVPRRQQSSGGLLQARGF